MIIGKTDKTQTEKDEQRPVEVNYTEPPGNNLSEGKGCLSSGVIIGFFLALGIGIAFWEVFAFLLENYFLEAFLDLFRLDEKTWGPMIFYIFLISYLVLNVYLIRKYFKIGGKKKQIGEGIVYFMITAVLFLLFLYSLFDGWMG